LSNEIDSKIGIVDSAFVTAVLMEHLDNLIAVGLPFANISFLNSSKFSNLPVIVIECSMLACDEDFVSGLLMHFFSEGALEENCS